MTTGAPSFPRGWGWAASGVAVVVTLSGFLSPSQAFYERDVLGYWVPHIEVFVREAAALRWPIWNRYVGFGAPLLGEPAFSLVYPLTWFNLLVPPVEYYKVFVAFHLVWASVGAWRLARRFGFSSPEAFVAAAGFGLSGPFLSAASLFHHFAGASWLPWVLTALEDVLAAPRRRAVLGLGVAAALQALAGSADMCFFSAILGGLRAVVHLRQATLPAAGRTMASLLAAALLAGSLAAVQWAPTAALVQDSWRGRMTTDTAGFWSIHPLTLVDAALPGSLADLPLGEGARRELYDSRPPLLRSSYLGFLALALAGFGLVRGGRAGIGVALVCALLLWLALGRHGHAQVLWSHVPIRYPAKFLLPLSLGVAILAAIGLRALPGGERGAGGKSIRGLVVALAAWAVLCMVAAAWAWGNPAALAPWLATWASPTQAARELAIRFLLGALLAALAAGLAAWRWRATPAKPAQAWVWSLLVAADLALAGRGANLAAPRELLTVRPPVLGSLRAAQARRIHSVLESSDCQQVVREPVGWPPATAPILGRVERLAPPMAARWGLFGSFDGEFTGLGKVWAWPVTDAVWTSRGDPEGRRLLQVAGVDHVVLLGGGDYGGLPLVAEHETVNACPVRVLRVPDPLPWVYVVGAERAGDTVAVLTDASFDPRREVAVAGGRSRAAPPDFTGRAALLRERGDEIVVEAETNADAVLVLLEAYDSGWRATIDGGPAEVMRANVLFRAVRIPPGRHTVRFVYRPPALVWGAGLSLLGLVVTAGLAWRTRG